MKVLVGCEFSGVVRDAFIRLGHDAMSCDLLPTEVPGPHYQGDLRDVLDYPWDLAIFHPPCTHLSVSGARHFEAKRMDGRQQAAVSFFMRLAKADIPRIAIENPVCIMSSLWRKPDQTLQPWQFGHPETKATCLWLKGLPPLVPTNVVEGREQRIHRMPPSEDRWKERSRTFTGIGEAMALQWGGATSLFSEAAE
jgi:site-specific DNA-cytosine methylase